MRCRHGIFMHAELSLEVPARASLDRDDDALTASAKLGCARALPWESRWETRAWPERH